MSDWEKIAFLEHELLLNLKMNTPGWKNEFTKWFNKAVDIIWQYKKYLINKVSDEQDFEEATWH